MRWWGGWRGRGFRWMFWLTGMPRWVRWGYGYSGVYPWFWRCRWFPWLPRGWWTGMYGPVTWTPQGPVLAQQIQQHITQPTVQNEIEYLKEQKRMLEEELKAIEKRIKELEAMLK